MVRWGALTVVASALGILVSLGGLQARYDRGFGDLWLTMEGQRSEAKHVAIVSIDDATLDAHRAEPLVTWGPYHARVLSVLREVGARLVVIDLDFAVSVEEWLEQMDIQGSDLSRTYDIPFREQLSQGGILLVAGLGTNADGGAELHLPTPGLLYSLPGAHADLGLANLVQDDDGVVRHFTPAVAGSGPPPRLTLATLSAVRAAGKDSEAEAWDFGELHVKSDLTTVPIGWVGPPNSIPEVSYQKLLADGAVSDPEVAALADKIVILGSDHLSLHDYHLSPFGQSLFGARQMMSGPELQGNIIETLLGGRSPSRVHTMVVFLLLVIAVGLACWLALNLKLVPAFFAVVAVAGVWAAASWACFRSGWLLDVGGVHLSCAAAYVGALGMRLTGEERRREELIRDFGRYVSDEVVDLLLKSGRTPNLGGESIEISVLFMDIRNFTTLSERLKAAEVVTMLNAFFSRAVAAVTDQRGMVDKFIGDGMMAIFGSPVPYQDHAIRAARAALGIEQCAHEFRAWVQEHLGDRDIPEFGIGVGVHTGEAVTGNVGSPKRMQFTAIGDTVNTSARLEGLTKQLGVRIVISQAVVDAVGRSNLVLGLSKEMHVKGRSQAVMVHELKALREENSGS